MKIAILSPFYPYRGGIAQFSAMLYTALGKEHEVKAFSFSRLYPEVLFPGKSQFVEKGDHAIEVLSERLLDSINPFSYQKTANAIAGYKPDILIIAYWMSFFGPALGHIANQLKKKTCIITLVHNAIPHEPRFFDRFFARLLFTRSKGFIAMSEIVKKDILSLAPDARISLQPHPLYDHFGEKISKLEARKQLEIDPGKKTLLFFGLIRDYKGLDLLIDAMPDLSDEYQLLIAGECYGSFDEYDHRIGKSPAKDRIKAMNRYIDDLLVPVLFSAADLLVLPYKSATQSGVIPVAYHFEIPVIATNVGGLRDSIEVPGTGLICNPDATSIAESVQQAFNQGLQMFTENIRQEKKKLSWENFSRKTILFSESL